MVWGGGGGGGGGEDVSYGLLCEGWGGVVEWGEVSEEEGVKNEFEILFVFWFFGFFFFSKPCFGKSM